MSDSCNCFGCSRPGTPNTRGVRFEKLPSLLMCDEHATIMDGLLQDSRDALTQYDAPPRIVWSDTALPA